MDIRQSDLVVSPAAAGSSPTINGFGQWRLLYTRTTYDNDTNSK